MGYVGAVTAGCLAKNGHEVIGVDLNETKVGLINRGMSPIIEKEIPEIIQQAVADGKLTASLDVAESVRRTELSLICVGTPSQLNGSLDLKYVRRVCEQIGEVIKEKSGFHVVVCRSTILPGSMRQVVIPTLEEYSGKKAGVDFGVCNNPEFLREGTAVYDFYNPPKTVIGETDPKSGDMLARIYDGLDAPMIRTEIETAEMVKYADNNWHAVKICFANEIGNLCKKLGIDSHKVMDIFCQDKKLNISSYYMKPGFAFGGSCLPKDVRALTYKGKILDLELPLLNAVLPSNKQQVENGIRLITAMNKKKIGILGFSFKAGTDDLRESPMVEVIEFLLGKGCDIKIYDRNVNVAKLMGANKDYILNRIPHIANLMVDNMETVLQHADVIVVGNNSDEFSGISEQLSDQQTVVDLARIKDEKSGENYEGICW